MNTCDTCKHWDGRELCDHDWRICKVLEDKRNKWDKFKDGIVFSGSLDDDRNTIHTGPKFGCIHWEEKE